MDMTGVELLVVNAHQQLEKTEDQVEGLVGSMSRLSRQSLASLENH
jgi:hypothetical protein